MKIFLAGVPHTLCRWNGGYEFAKAAIEGNALSYDGEESMIIYLAGGVSGNLKPAWNKTARRDDVSLSAFCEELQNENFWQKGESRHSLHDGLSSPSKENENIFGRRSTVERRGRV